MERKVGIVGIVVEFESGLGEVCEMERVLRKD